MLACTIVVLINCVAFDACQTTEKYEEEQKTETITITKTTTNLLDFVALVRHDPGQLIAVDIVHERHPNVHAPLVHVVEGSGMDTVSTVTLHHTVTRIYRNPTVSRTSHWPQRAGQQRRLGAPWTPSCCCCCCCCFCWLPEIYFV